MMNREDALTFINKLIEFCGRGGAVVEMDEKNVYITPYLVRKELLISQARETWLEEGALGPRLAREAEARNSELVERLKDAEKNALSRVADAIWGAPAPALEELIAILMPERGSISLENFAERRQRLAAWLIVRLEREKHDRESQPLPPEELRIP